MLLLMAIVGMTANAQNEIGQLTLQPKIGLNLANLTEVEVVTNPFTNETESGKLKGDFVIGAEAEYYTTTPWLCQGADFGTYKLYGNPDGSVSDGWDKYQCQLSYLNIPIVANYYFSKGWAVKVGIQPGFLLSAKKKVDGLGYRESEDTDIKDIHKTFDFSIPFGISYEKNNWVFDGRYNLGLTKVNKEGDKNSKNSVIQFTVGYKFSL